MPWRAPSLVLLAALGAAPAAAQELNRRAFPVGEEAVGMGGAYTGLARDASAAFYNPGGLAMGRRGSIGVSLSLSLVDRYQVGAFEPESTELEYTDALGVPFYAGGAVQIGDEGVRHGLAFATFSLNNLNRRFLVAAQDGAGARSLQVRRSDRTRWYGVSYGVRPLRELGFGVSAFIATRSFRHEEEEIVRVGGRALTTRLAQIDLNAELLLFRVGARWAPDRHWSFGLVLQPPAIVVGGRAALTATAARADASGVESTRLSREVGADSPLPFQLRGGASWQPTPDFVLNADVIVEAPLGSAEDPIQRLDVDPDEPALLGAYLATRYHSEWVVDVAVGGRGVIADLVPLSAGLFTSFSSAPSLPEAPTRYQPDQLTLLGASLGVGVMIDDVDFTIGVVGTVGFGTGLAAGPFGGLGAPSYRPQDVSSQTLFVYVVGAGSAAAAVGRSVAEELLGVDEDDMEGGEGEHGADDGDDAPDGGAEERRPPAGPRTPRPGRPLFGDPPAEPPDEPAEDRDAPPPDAEEPPAEAPAPEEDDEAPSLPDDPGDEAQPPTTMPPAQPLARGRGPDGRGRAPRRGARRSAPVSIRCVAQPSGPTPRSRPRRRDRMPHLTRLLANQLEAGVGASELS